ncbi:flavin reductase [Paractinoplanes abujensis]|uniref:Uncharacterized protein YbjT (DUF2867 family) n=1 Tax=Paractinoplanes abujensis TaxID=882441 RepID=A0A7W7CV76_9ACTN|nr:NAD(P)-binding oxidoreductase [Actinoplanes abujensis]MBB4693903.1 uncharacterized protein YbjT (DUF2867 family) [Actinoplanes abujensis]GID21441.1 flavin reductase [Actinoplanes abujensis]
MRVAVLGASGGTGRRLVRAALSRGLPVVEIARSLPPPAVHADVHDPESIKRAVEGCDVLLSGLGIVKDSPPGTLTAGARAAVASGVPRVIWLGAFGTGRSAPHASGLTRAVLGAALRRELTDKIEADEVVLAAGGTVFHAGRLTDGPLAAFRSVAVKDAPHRVFPAGISRATVAAAMIEEAVHSNFPGRIAVPLE